MKTLITVGHVHDWFYSLAYLEQTEVIEKITRSGKRFDFESIMEFYEDEIRAHFHFKSEAEKGSRVVNADWRYESGLSHMQWHMQCYKSGQTKMWTVKNVGSFTVKLFNS